jgi:hypothetical protein
LNGPTKRRLPAVGCPFEITRLHEVRAGHPPCFGPCRSAEGWLGT